MIPLSTWISFLAASFVLLAVPGPAVLYILARSSAQGFRAGLIAVAGVHAASIVHVLAAVLGLSTVVVASATAFTVVKWVGGGYLIFLGVRTIVGSQRPADAARDVGPRSRRQLFTESFVVNLLNPKVALFFLAFLPQFADPGRGPVWLQLFVLGAAYVVVGIATDGLYAVAGGTVGRRVLTATTAIAVTPRLVEGGVLIGLGLFTLVVPQRRG